jgi:Tol biopolymer transport system component/DNA-binding winged helix-turn-helix (wHTH) protein
MTYPSLAVGRPRAVRFDVFQADFRTGELRKHGRRRRLPHQSFTALSMLTARAGDLVTREELCRELWPSGTFVDYDQGLNAVINRLRDALGDSAAEPRFIETLPKRGYRFIAPVTIIDEPEPASTTIDAPSPQPAADGHVASRRPAVLIVAVGLVLTSLLIFGIWSRVRRPAVTTFEGDRVVPFTSLVAEERAPSFSPDGSHVVFAWNGDTNGQGGFDLYVKALGAERLLRLTAHPARWLSPAWSPDGSRIAFARSADDASGLYVVSALGGDEQRLVDVGFSSPTFMRPSWSPDGRTLAYSSSDETGSHIVSLLSLDDMHSRRLVPAPACWDAGAPAFSPDGAKIAVICTSSMAVYTVYLCALDGSAPTPLASMMGQPAGLAWLADGSALVVANDGGEGGSLWRLGLDGALSRLPFGEEGASPAVARDGRLAYVRGREDVNIWRIDLSAPEPGTTARRVLASTRIDMTPQYAPAGGRIAFASNRSGSQEIWVANSDGANPVRVTRSNGALTGAPAWCADGRRLAFDSRVSGTAAVYVVDAAGGAPRVLETDRGNLALPAWSSDCRWIVASDGRNALFKIPSDGGPARPFTTQQAYYAQVIGERVIFNVKTSPHIVLWSKTIDGANERALAGMPPLAYADPWTVAEGGVYFIQSAASGATVARYDFASHSVRTLAHLAHAPTPLGGLGLAVSGDERWLLYTQTDGADADIMVVEGK